MRRGRHARAVLLTKCLDLVRGRRRPTSTTVAAIGHRRPTSSSSSVVTGQGIERTSRSSSPAAPSCFLGESGGGKSTLTNLLVGDDVLAVGETRADGQGRHTTSHRELVALPGGGAIIDTPGVREVVAAITRDQVDEGFADVTALAAQCRVLGLLARRTEPGRAVAAALARRLAGRRRRLAAYDAADPRRRRGTERRAEQGRRAPRSEYRAIRAPAERRGVW